MTPTYFILAGSHVKIGRSQNPEARVSQIATSCPVAPKLLKVSSIDERTAHRIAATITTRENGEWFMDSPGLREWIETLPACDVIKPMATAKAVPNTAANPKKQSFPSFYDMFSHYALTIVFDVADLLGVTPKDAAKIYLATQAKKASQTAA